MRGISLALMAFLAMTSVSLGAVVLDASFDGVPVVSGVPQTGYRTFTVTATGPNVNVLQAFTITGGVYQVGTNSTWLGNGSATGDPMDSYVIFGTTRLPDWVEGVATGFGPVVTTETGGTGVGTLNNLITDDYDAYVRVGYEPDVSETVDLLKLVIPEGATVSVGLKLETADFNAETGYYTTITEYNFTDTNALSIYSPLNGDTDMDGDVDSTDFENFATGWFPHTGTWATGDFDFDGDVDSTDFELLASNWPGLAGEGAGVAVPEPGTLILLVLGSVCLVGYRLRK